VIGLGLIGGSVLRAAAEAGRQVWGASAAERDAAAAVADGFQVTGTPEACAARQRPTRSSW
jgi:prephenate dehydrogenase